MPITLSTETIQDQVSEFLTLSVGPLIGSGRIGSGASTCFRVEIEVWLKDSCQKTEVRYGSRDQMPEGLRTSASATWRDYFVEAGVIGLDEGLDDTQDGLVAGMVAHYVAFLISRGSL